MLFCCADTFSEVLSLSSDLSSSMWPSVDMLSMTTLSGVPYAADNAFLSLDNALAANRTGNGVVVCMMVDVLNVVGADVNGAAVVIEDKGRLKRME